MARLKLPLLSRRTARRLTLALAVVAVAATFLLAAGLPEMELRPGQSFSVVRPTPVARPPSGGLLQAPWMLTVIVVVALCLFAASFVIVIRSPEDRKSVGKYAARLAILAAIVTVAVSLRERPAPAAVTATSVPGPPAPAAPNPTGPAVNATGVPIAYAPARTSGWVGFGVALLVVLGAGALVYAAWRSTRVKDNEIVEIARSALGDLAAGRNWEDVVVRCYADMSTALSQQRGIARQEAMTPREFAARLEQAGFPGAAVRTLTQLFEKARYGSRHSSSAESQQAVDALQAIMQAMEDRR